MLNKKIIIKKNLYHNLEQFSVKKVCAMVKSDAYGHGIEEIVKLLSDKVEYFGVANEFEGQIVRKITDKPILVVGKVFDYPLCKNSNLEIMVDNEMSIKRAIENGLKDNLHLKINCGMNRFGVCSYVYAKMIDKLLGENNIKLKSIFTHFPKTNDILKTKRQHAKFLEIKSAISQKPMICFGGSNIIDFDFDFDMIRVGIGLYGYERKNLWPVMQIKSKVVKVFFVKKGEFVGYGDRFKVKKSGFFAVVPIGYGDGLFRNLSGKFYVCINEKIYMAVGNVCMDVFFVCVDENVKSGDEVIVMSDANVLAKQLKTISYEVLTNFSKIRADVEIL